MSLLSHLCRFIVLLSSFCPVVDAYAPSSSNNNNKNDWAMAQRTLHDFFSTHQTPTADLQSPAEVAMACLRSLQFVDYPVDGAGLQRIYPFLTWNCIKHVVGENDVHGSLGGQERFGQRGALSPVLQTFFGATQIVLDETASTTIAATPTRGKILIFPVHVTTAPATAFCHASGVLKDGIARNAPTKRMILRLEQQRRPPLAGCWLVRDIIDAKYAKGGNGWSRDEGV